MILVLMGESGAGKDFLFNHTDNFESIVSYTTRPMREKEVNGREYHFVDDKFMKDINDTNPDFFLEKREYNAIKDGKEVLWTYASPRVNPEDNNYKVILDVQGTLDYINAYGADNVEVVYVKAPEEIRRQRAIDRDPNKFDKDEWERRAKDDAIKFKDTEMVISKALGRELLVFNNNKSMNDNLLNKVVSLREWDELIDNIEHKTHLDFEIE